MQDREYLCISRVLERKQLTTIAAPRHFCGLFSSSMTLLYLVHNVL